MTRCAGLITPTRSRFQIPFPCGRVLIRHATLSCRHVHSSSCSVAFPLGLAARSLPRFSAEGTTGHGRRPEQMGEVWYSNQSETTKATESVGRRSLRR